MSKLKYLLIVISFCLTGCNLLIKDEPQTGIDYVPLEYTVLSIKYIKNIESTKTVTHLTHVDNSNYKLSIYAPVTNASKVSVKNIKINDNEIYIELNGSSNRSRTLSRPYIEVMITGINPYNEQNYTAKVISNYNIIKNNLSESDVLKIITPLKSDPDEPILLSNLIKNYNGLYWNINLLMLDSDNTILLHKIVINDKTKKIEQNTKINISQKIAYGKVLCDAENNSFYFVNGENLFLYDLTQNYPKDLNLKVKNMISFAFDETQNKLYILNESGGIEVIKKDEIIKQIHPETDEKILDLKAFNNKLVLLTENSNLYLYENEKSEKILQINKDIFNFDFNSEIVYWSGSDLFNSKIFKLSKSQNPVFIDKGASPIILNDKIYYIKNSESTSTIVSYNLKTGLSLDVCSSEKLKFVSKNKNSILFMETKNSKSKIYELKDDIYKYVIPIQDGVVYSNFGDGIYILNQNDTIFKLDLNKYLNAID
ncbi:MAG: hypothetical protein MSH08_02025 [Ezakiella sp.]|nr:hypothetical protein [Ezakiella sp.]MDD7472241.1 hypothetical protein [Bacillota bacterium]MDY3923758.1 hypothetical protein [Ezakiella sp.]